MKENIGIAHDRFTVTIERRPLAQGYGVAIPVPCAKLEDGHPCKGCVWYARDTDVLFCPFPNCIRKK